VSGTDVPALNAAHRAALAGGKPLVCVCPPAWWSMQAVLAELAGAQGGHPGTLILVPELEEHDDLESAAACHEGLAPVHLATGVTRTSRLLRGGGINSLAATPLDLIRLIEMSVLKAGDVRQVIVAWPEAYDKPAIGGCETVLAETRSASRIIVTSDRASMPDFLERHAHRAPAYEAEGAPGPIPHPIRYAVVPSTRRPWALRAALDIINPATSVVWDPLGRMNGWLPMGITPEAEHDNRVDLAITTDLPTTSVLSRLAGRSESVLVLIRATQLRYLPRITSKAEAFRLPSAADRARHGAYVRRAELRQKLESDVSLGVLTTLEPLLDEFDPVLIAAVAIADRWQEPSGPDQATWTTIRVDKGKQDGIRAGDLVGALVNAVGVQSRDVGRIDLRGSFSLIEIRPEDSPKAMRGLNGLVVRGQRITARLDDTRRAGSEGFSPTSRSRRP